jgi:two-component system sensor histidine kinase/response regulator
MNTILENSTVGIVFVKDRKQVWANARMADIFGFAVEECRNQSTRMYYLSEADFNALGQDGYATIAEGGRYISERQMRHKQRGAIWVRLSGKAVDTQDSAWRAASSWRPVCLPRHAKAS